MVQYQMTFEAEKREVLETLDSTVLRIKSRLIHILSRVKRLQIPEDNADGVTVFKNEAYANEVYDFLVIQKMFILL